MPDQTDLATQLARLSPEVDEAAARSLFERRCQPAARTALADARCCCGAGVRRGGRTGAGGDR